MSASSRSALEVIGMSFKRTATYRPVTDTSLIGMMLI